LSIARFALVNVALIVAWMAIALVVLRRHDALLERRPLTALTPSAFRRINVRLTILWLWVAVRIAREPRQRTT
jgi:hypothetical protein